MNCARFMNTRALVEIYLNSPCAKLEHVLQPEREVPVRGFFGRKPRGLLLGDFKMIFPVFITASSLAIEAGPDLHCYAATPSGSDGQKWNLVYYPEKDAVAMVLKYNGIDYVLSAPAGEFYPTLRPFQWDDSYLWRCPHLLGNEGIATVRDDGWCLTWEDENPVAGTKLKYLKWWGMPRQKF